MEAPDDLCISILHFPSEIVKKCSGLGYDIGGSAAKFIYRTKETWEMLKSDKDLKKAPLNLLTCGHNSIEFALDKIKQEAHIIQGSKIFSCGVVGYQRNDYIQELFGNGIANVLEIDCNIEGLKFCIENLPEADIVYPLDKDEIGDQFDKAQLTINSWTDLDKGNKYQLFQNHYTELKIPEITSCDSVKSLLEVKGHDLYPCLYLMLGSAFVVFKIDKDKKPQYFDVTLKGGKYFLGVGSLLTGSKSYYELINKAEKGNHSKVNQTWQSLFKADASKSETDPYSIVTKKMKDEVVYYFGQAVGEKLGDFNSDDIALAWLLSTIEDIVHNTMMIASVQDINNILIGGSFANRDIVRKYIMKEFILRDGLTNILHGKQVIPNVKFLKHGGLNAAIGCMLNSIEQFTIDRQ